MQQYVSDVSCCCSFNKAACEWRYPQIAFQDVLWFSLAPAPRAEGLQTFHVIENPDEEARRELILFGLRRKMGRDQRLTQVYELLPDLARSDAPVLLQGERGTEKQLLARAIHALSARASGPYHHVPCREKSPEELTRALLGSLRHGGSEERTAQAGFLENAHRGTLFLEGIEALPYPLQVSLFKAMEEGEYTPQGADQRVSSDIRLVASTQADLERKVREGTFPQSLFYCLNVFKIHLPPLRERKEDILGLARDILWRLRLESDKDVTDLDEEAGRLLQTYPFPGNIHELEKVLQQAHQNASGNILRTYDLPRWTFKDRPSLDWQPDGESPVGTPAGSLTAERSRILGTLIQNRWNRKRAARDLGMDRTTLWRWMKPWESSRGTRRLESRNRPDDRTSRGFVQREAGRR